VGAYTPAMRESDDLAIRRARLFVDTREGRLKEAGDIVDPVRRVGIGTVAMVVALSVGAFLFGPLSEARSRALAAPTVLHNSAGARTSIGVDAGTRTGSSNDVSADARERARNAAQEARRRASRAA